VKSDGQYALPANAARRLLEIASTMEPAPEGHVDIGKLNYAFLAEGASPDEYKAGIEKLKADGLVRIHESGTRLYFTDKGSEPKPAVII